MGEIFIINTFKRLLVSERGCAFTHGLVTSVFLSWSCFPSRPDIFVVHYGITTNSIRDHNCDSEATSHCQGRQNSIL